MKFKVNDFSLNFAKFLYLVTKTTEGTENPYEKIDYTRITKGMIVPDDDDDEIDNSNIE